MKLYEFLSRLPVLNTRYAGKFLLVAFVGIHIPLLALTIYLSNHSSDLTETSIFTICLIFTLLATALTFLVLHGLTAPLRKLSSVVKRYKADRLIDKIETESNDEVGNLVRHTIDSMVATEALLKQKQDLLYLFTHDLKNFAMSPEFYAKEILETKPSQAVADFCKQIIESAQKQKHFLVNFTDLLQEEERLSKLNFKLRSFTAAPCFSAVKDRVAPLAQQKGVELSFDGHQISATIKIDLESLIMVLSNLAHNAVKFTPSGGIVTVRCIKENHNLQFIVTDNGIGFNNDDVKILFKKFTSLGRVGTNGELSTGIGLYLSRQYIRKAGGEIDAFSRGENQGATFTISLKTYRRK